MVGWRLSNTSLLGTGGAICRFAEHLAHNSETAGRPQERRKSILLQVQRSNLCQACQVGDHVQTCQRGKCQGGVGGARRVRNDVTLGRRFLINYRVQVRIGGRHRLCAQSRALNRTHHDQSRRSR
jgi:hypothetical protein